MREPGGSRRTGTRSRWGKRGTDATLFASTSADESPLWVINGLSALSGLMSAMTARADSQETLVTSAKSQDAASEENEKAPGRCPGLRPSSWRLGAPLTTAIYSSAPVFA